MSNYLEPSFLLELGAYAVAIAGIRIFKSRYWGTGAQPSADVTPYPEQHVAPGQVSCRCNLSYPLAAVYPARQEISFLLQVATSQPGFPSLCIARTSDGVAFVQL